MMKPNDPGFAPAKVNLFLHATGRRDDGYHLLQSLVVFPRFGDHLGLKVMRSGNGPTLGLAGPFAPALKAAGGGGADDLILRAARALGDQLGRRDDLRGLQFDLVKNIPVASGLGGGSADAAAALRLLAARWEEPATGPVVREVALALGADVPICLTSRPQILRGIGDILVPAPALPANSAMLLVNPGVAVSTADIFQNLAPEHFHAAAAFDDFPSAFETLSDLCNMLAETGNDLAPAAIVLVPAIADLLAGLKTLPGAKFTAMSGSGASCFALFESSSVATVAKEILQQRYPGYWVAAVSFD